MLFVLFDNLISQALRRLFPTQYKITGACRKCGKCCEEIRLQISPKFLTSKFFTDLVIRWTSWLFDFYLIEVDFKNQELLFSCKQ
ncbi:hypothetical protein ACFL52_03760, partial [Candidatus Margulisiibacteriota bacterium]